MEIMPFILILIFIIATLVGYKLISNVPSLLHTPLMSGMNALSGLAVLGALTATAMAMNTGSRILGGARRHPGDDQCGGRFRCD